MSAMEGLQIYTRVTFQVCIQMKGKSNTKHREMQQYLQLIDTKTEICFQTSLHVPLQNQHDQSPMKPVFIILLIHVHPKSIITIRH